MPVRLPLVPLLLVLVVGILLGLYVPMARWALLVSLLCLVLALLLLWKRFPFCSSLLHLLFFACLGAYLAVPYGQQLAAEAFVPNPDTPDYSVYRLLHPSAEAAGDSGPVTHLSQTVRGVLSHRIGQSGVGEECESLYRALLHGDKSGVSSEVRTLYRQTGCSHLLALSGLHLSVFLFVLSWVVLRWFRYKRTWWLVFPVAVSLIWGYVFVAGCPPSLVRAATLSSVALLLVQRRSVGSALSTLALAAIVILVPSPLSVLDIGFQLSFVCMLGLLWIYSPLASMMGKVRRFRRGWRRVVANIVDVLLMSVACVLASAPLCAYYFHELSLLGILLSPVLIPMTALHLLGAACCAFLGSWVTWAAPLFDVGVHLQHGLMAWTHQAMGLLSLANVWPTRVSVVLMYVALGTICYMLALLNACCLRRRWAMPTVLLGICLVSIAVVQSLDRTEPQLVFYYSRHCPAAHCIRSEGESYLLPAREDSVEALLLPVTNRFWAHRLKTSPRVLQGERWMERAGVRVVLVNDYYWCRVADRLSHPLETDYLWVCRGFRGHMDELTRAFSPRLVVLDASLGRYYTERFSAECDSLNLQHHDMLAKGALIVPLDKH